MIVDGSGQPISREAAESTARSVYPGWDVSDVRTGETANHAIEVSLASGDRTTRRLLHPFTGEDLGDPLPAGYRLSAWLLDLHDNLLGGETGRRVNGVGAVLLILLCATGAVIWWPGVGRLRRSLLVSPRANWKRVTWSLHSALGFWFFAFVLIWGVSGAYLSFPQAFGALLDVLEPLDEANPVERVVDRIQNRLVYLHFGRLGGRGIPGCGRGLCNSTTMLVWAIVGMVPAVMFVTGALMWWNRVLGGGASPRPPGRKLPGRWRRRLPTWS